MVPSAGSGEGVLRTQSNATPTGRGGDLGGWEVGGRAPHLGLSFCRRRGPGVLLQLRPSEWMGSPVYAQCTGADKPPGKVVRWLRAGGCSRPTAVLGQRASASGGFSWDLVPTIQWQSPMSCAGTNETPSTKQLQRVTSVALHPAPRSAPCRPRAPEAQYLEATEHGTWAGSSVHVFTACSENMEATKMVPSLPLGQHQR